MRMHELNFKGWYEDGQEVAERLQLAEPENELEQAMLGWAILPNPETITEDSARRDYVFTYELGDYLDRGLYKLLIAARDGSDQVWEAHLAAGLIVTAGSPDERRRHGFAPFWFLSEALHFKADRNIESKYGGHAFGHLAFGRSGALPHARLFRATV